MEKHQHIIDYAEVVTFLGTLRGMPAIAVKATDDDDNRVTVVTTLDPELFKVIFKQLKKRYDNKHTVVSIVLTDDDDPEQVYYVSLPGKDARTLYKLMKAYKKLCNI